MTTRRLERRANEARRKDRKNLNRLARGVPAAIAAVAKAQGLQATHIVPEFNDDAMAARIMIGETPTEPIFTSRVLSEVEKNAIAASFAAHAPAVLKDQLPDARPEILSAFLLKLLVDAGFVGAAS
jgi:hypothetical protein